MNCRSDRKYKVIDPHNRTSWVDCSTMAEARAMAWKRRWIVVSYREEVRGAKIPKA